jgi:2',3'-cyclic-nucleotide 2'-phosphodiesterase (5'-nucleotidase family)
MLAAALSLAWLAAVGAAPASAPLLEPDKLVILSTTDNHGETSPCGCSTPRGGIARRASFVDSMRTSYSQILLVDNGGFFPIEPVKQDVGPFLMDMMKALGTHAVGLGDRELTYGLDFLKTHVERTGLDVISTNLLDRRTRKPCMKPWVIQKVGSVNVGIFSLISPQVGLGPSQDQLLVEAPDVAAKRAVAELRRKGATVIVLLSQLGRTETEDLANTVDGIDVLMPGRNVPLLQKGRMLKNSLLVYGGERGQYMGRSILTLDGKRRMATGENEMFMLGPTVGEDPKVLGLVKSFEDNLNEKLRKAEKERAAKKAAENAGHGPDRYLGSAVCMRCHEDQAEQWQTTPHAHAWQTLIDAKKDATPDCIPCHVVGYQKSGGFVSGVETPALSNVQCENCHGMGTQHDAWAETPRAVTEATCTQCHQGDHDLHWNFEAKVAKVIH